MKILTGASWIAVLCVAALVQETAHAQRSILKEMEDARRETAGGSLALGLTVALATKGRTCPTLVVALADSPLAKLGRARQSAAEAG